MSATGSSSDSAAGARARGAALGTDCRPGGPGASAGEGIAETTAESPVTHLARGVLRRAAARSWSGSRPCASRLFRVVDRVGGGAASGSGFQHDAARVRPAARWCLSRREAQGLPVLHDDFGVQPAPYFEKLPGGRSAQNYRVASGCGRAGTRGIAEGCSRDTPHLHLAGGGTTACGEGSRVSGSRLRSTARWWTRF